MGRNRAALGQPPVTPATSFRLDELPGLEGGELGPSDWVEITQERIDAFASSADDSQWIHVDPGRAAEGPFGATVAHGFLTLALAVRFWNDLARVEDAALTINYGLNRARFPAPVPAGSRIRGRLRILEVREVERGVQAVVEATIERDGGEKPVCVAELVLRFLR